MSTTLTGAEKTGYIQRMAAIRNISLDGWVLDQDFEFQNTDTDINLRMAELRDQRISSQSDSAALSAEDMLNIETRLSLGIESRKTSLRDEISSFKRNAGDSYYSFTEYLDRAMGKRQELNALNGSDGKDIQNRIIELAKGNQMFKFTGLENNRLIFETRNDIWMSQVNPAAGIDIKVNFSKFRIIWPVMGSYIKVLKAHDWDGLSINGHIHPYIGDGGAICWGSNEAEVRELITKFKFKEVMEMLASLLVTYTTDNRPWVALDEFHRRQEGISETCETCENALDECNCTDCSECGERMHHDEVCSHGIGECCHCSECCAENGGCCE